MNRKMIISIFVTICMVVSLCGCSMVSAKQDVSKAEITNYGKVDLDAIMDSVEKKL